MNIIKKMQSEYADYQFDESRMMGSAEYIAFPSTLAELIDVVCYCRDHHLPLTCQGGMTGLAGGASPKSGLALNLSHMNRILGLRRDDRGYLLRLQPGLRLTQLRKALADKAFDISDWAQESIDTLREIKAGEYFFSPDPTEPTASLGGMAACNACGARSFLYGCTREHINALKIVLASGEAISMARGQYIARGRELDIPTESGRIIHLTLPDFETPPIKDAGYFFRKNMDAVDLFIGSQGTLGIIAELEVRLMKSPAHLWGITAFFPDDESALAYVRALKGKPDANIPPAPLRPAAIEFFDKNALTMVERQKEFTPAFDRLQPLPENYCCAVYTEYNTEDPAIMDAALPEIAKLLSATGGDPARTWVARDALELEQLLFFRHAIPETIDLIVEKNKKNDPSITILSTDMSVDDAHFDELFHIYRHDLMQTDLDWIIFGHIGENHVHPNILARTGAEYEKGHMIFEKWARDVHAMGGSISAEHGAGKIKRKLALIMYGEANMLKLIAFKRTLDPDFLLGPGNIITEVEEG